MDRHHELSRVDSCLGDRCLRQKGSTNSRPGTNFLDSSSATPLSTPGRCDIIDGAYRLSAMSNASSRAMTLIGPDLALSFDAMVSAATLSELTAMTARSLRQWSCHCRRLTRRASASRTCWSSDPRPVSDRRWTSKQLDLLSAQASPRPSTQLDHLSAHASPRPSRNNIIFNQRRRHLGRRSRNSSIGTGVALAVEAA